jgi:SAM-dependent methyltransferase
MSRKKCHENTPSLSLCSDASGYNSTMPDPASQEPQLFKMDPTGRFSDRADAYARYRPGYPSEAISAIVDSLRPAKPPDLTAADIGAGTGIFSRLLGVRGLRVLAIEPNEAMRLAGAPHPNVEYLPGSAEATGLKDASVDLITCAQAFHWFHHDKALPEFRRVLKPTGRLSVLWNDRDHSDPLTAEYGRLILKASDNHPAAEDRGACAEALEHSSLFANIKIHLFRYEQPLDQKGLIGRAQSASYVPKEGPKLDDLLEGLTDLHRRFADLKGIVRMVYCTRVYVAEPAR